MKRSLFISLIVVALVAGILTPIIANILTPQTTRTSTSPPTHTVSIERESVMREIVSPRSVELKSFDNYTELYEYLGSIDAATAITTLGTPPVSEATITVVPVMARPIATVAPAREEYPTTTQSTRYSTTNVQVPGVDEIDIVKNNGSILAIASGSSVFIVGVKERSVLSKISLGESVRGLFLYKNLLIIVSENRESRMITVLPDTSCSCRFVIPPETIKTTTYLYDVSNPSRPVLISSISATGSLVSSRMIDGYLYLVLSQPIFREVIPLVNGRAVRPESIVLIDPVPTTYTTIVSIDVENKIYSVRSFMTGASSWMYSSLKRIYLATTVSPTILEVYNLTTEILARYVPQIRARLAEALTQRNMTRYIEIVRDYLASLDLHKVESLISSVNSELSRIFLTSKTRFYVFSVSGVEVSYRGFFDVEGVVLDQFSMEEYKDHFIIATTSRNWSVMTVLTTLTPTPLTAPSSGSVIVIQQKNNSYTTITQAISRVVSTTTRPLETIYPFYAYIRSVGVESNNVFIVDLSSLRVVSSLRGLAEGERIYSARLVKNIFFLVTFRETDPLFAIDVSDPERPRVIGFLKTPGFSDYIHPLSEDRLLGIGFEGSNLKISLYNVSDPTSMSEISKILIKDAWSIATSDHHAVTIDLDHRLVFIPIAVRGLGSGVAVISYTERSIDLARILTHENALRTAYAGNELFTISTSIVKIYSLRDLKEIGAIELR
ncbi:MAG: beta-propeller domain-containing protein [Sulfolobales archaeon]